VTTILAACTLAFVAGVFLLLGYLYVQTWRWRP
jgi:hypothetical protein